ncbi:hypothetical protein Glove_294g129 [Diversispora epigaea]|uniref:BTB domain-containing protein n=1 Tax=Diversispora epigaea TaxID=1348612 RepID=A0A397HZG4_9GLOM|nr:hypothetical protein Glove_294g129 [Diversispora epigaea]
MSLRFYDKLSQNFIELLNDKNDYNVIIEVENKEKSFTAHSNILKYRASYFHKELENILPNEFNIKIIAKPNISASIFDVILKYIYGGIVNLENVKTSFIFDLLLAADEFELEELINNLETFLIDTKGSWLRTHFSLIHHSIFNKNNFKKLENFCNDIIVKYPTLIFDRSDFISLSESALVSLLKRDDLQMKEIKIWECVIKWGISQNPTLPTNLEEWNKKNFLTLKTTLQQCLPLIRYFHISNDEIFDKIKPYKKILDKQLWEDINLKSIFLPARSVLVTELPPRTNEPNELSSTIIPEEPNELFSTITSEKPKEPFSTIISEESKEPLSTSIPEEPTEPFSTIFEEPKETPSTIISDEHSVEISGWIDRRMTTYSTTNVPYKFKLILRGTKDGFAPQTFWNICHGHKGTVVIIKIKGTDEIIGGYNPIAWNNTYVSGKYEKAIDSFIFSLKNGKIQNSILSRVKDSKRSICNISKSGQKEYGPHFFDFYMRNNSNFTSDYNDSCCINDNTGSYEKAIRTSPCFSIVYYEVFKVIRKS